MTNKTKTTAASALLGCVADDVTGATDLAINLAQGGMRVIQWLQIPTLEDLRVHEVDAIVVALKTRSIAPPEAVSQSIAAVEVLRGHGCRRFYFKYCSTFDSTERGNIGPVAEAMIDVLGVEQTIFCPAFPRAGRTVYQGHLFVGETLLSESGMQNHPLNPMQDANLVRFLSHQVTRSVGRLRYQELADANSAAGSLQKQRRDGIAHVVVDCVEDSQLQTIATAVSDMPLVTGGSGLARHLGDAYRQSGLMQNDYATSVLQLPLGRSLILSGSCSQATNRQVAKAKSFCNTWQLDVLEIARDPGGYQRQLAAWAEASDVHRPLLIYSTDDPDGVRRVQQTLGASEAAQLIESFLGKVAVELTADVGVRRLIVAGGETSGAVVHNLGIRALAIGPEICAGVPWTRSIGGPQLAIALKSGNFGDDNFFHTALEMLA
ncbi:3-oxo-tetronate kinase [Novipirellula caenicola]|uniref:3-oxo-tetronate kinase n=1 Tax=Novipirellula caenicola TaxID=1536901 RepID=A0ABP9VWS2_9BACT